ncbi:hypothetical protein [Celeribacter baekdonensis]|uniref:hypothetical protein n=1 Tax=Celeribacter baekdonensis TaxID=875171 RepID=UPI00115F9D8E|nr:hypothetical protein [Celeribacter baekdonensis]
MRIVEEIRIRNQASKGGVVKATLICAGIEIFLLYLAFYEPQWWREDRRYLPYLAHVLAGLMPFVYVWGVWTVPTTPEAFEKRLEKRRRRK